MYNRLWVPNFDIKEIFERIEVILKIEKDWSTFVNFWKDWSNFQDTNESILMYRPYTK